MSEVRALSRTGAPPTSPAEVWRPGRRPWPALDLPSLRRDATRRRPRSASWARGSLARAGLPAAATRSRGALRPTPQAPATDVAWDDRGRDLVARRRLARH